MADLLLKKTVHITASIKYHLQYLYIRTFYCSKLYSGLDETNSIDLVI